MAKITVDLEAFYGYSCGFQGHGSNETIEVEISDDELAALKQFDEDKVSSEDVAQAIEDGDPTLEALHEKLSDAFYNMVEEYWLFEAYNEFLYESLEESIKADIDNGLYTPTYVEDDDDSFDCYCCAAWAEAADEDSDADEDSKHDTLNATQNNNGENEDYDDEDLEDSEEDDEDDEPNYDLDAYHEWVKKHDHWFIAERVGLDLDACHDDEVSYTIRFEE